MVEQRPIVTGVRQQGFVEILEGVRPGERVVADGLNKIQTGQPVRISPRPSVIPTAGGAPTGAAPAAGARPGPGGRPGMRPAGPGAPSSPPAGARPVGQRPAA